MRSAQARGSVALNARAIRALLMHPSGHEVLTAARTAGIAAIEATPALIGSSDGVEFSGAALDLVVKGNGVEISALVHTSDNIDVATQALTAVTVAAISLIGHARDVCPSASIEYVRLDDVPVMFADGVPARRSSGL